MDGIVAATPEEERAQAMNASWEDAQRLGIQSQGDWLVRVLEAGHHQAALLRLQEELLEAECNDLQAVVDRIEENGLKVAPSIEKGIPGRPTEITTAVVVEFVNEHRSRKPPTPWKVMEEHWKVAHPEAKPISEAAMRSAHYRDQKKKRS
jgi:hypothetical protein